MYYDTQRKLVFVMPTKTGSQTLLSLLKSWGLSSIEGDMHTKLKDIPDIQSYTVYGFFRNPLDRFLSSLRYIKERRIASIILDIPYETVSAYSYDQFVDNFQLLNSKLNYYFDPQVEWLEGANLLDFNKFDLEILRVARMFDVQQVNIPVMNDTVPVNEVPSQKVIDFVQSYYAADYQLGREKGLLA